MEDELRDLLTRTAEMEGIGNGQYTLVATLTADQAGRVASLLGWVLEDIDS